jgi:hypothetical protein
MIAIGLREVVQRLIQLDLAAFFDISGPKN